MKHLHKVEPKHKSLGVYRSRIGKMKQAFRRKELTNVLAWWILLGVVGFETGVILLLILK